MRRSWMAVGVMASFLLLHAPAFSQDEAPGVPPIPPDVKQLLDSTYPGWRFAYHPPSYVTADFDQDGKKDYALQILRGSMASEEQDLVIVLNNAAGLTLQVLEARGEDPNIYLALKKGVELQKDAKTGVDKMFSSAVLRILGGPEGERMYHWDSGEMKEVAAPPPVDPSN